LRADRQRGGHAGPWRTVSVEVMLRALGVLIGGGALGVAIFCLRLVRAAGKRGATRRRMRPVTWLAGFLLFWGLVLAENAALAKRPPAAELLASVALAIGFTWVPWLGRQRQALEDEGFLPCGEGRE
jgi:hypothetical protein